VLLHRASPSSLGQLLGIRDFQKGTCNYIALKTYNKRGISNSTENMVPFNERESLNNGNGDGDFTAFYDQYELHTALPF
jgi:hypothetical protein